MITKQQLEAQGIDFEELMNEAPEVLLRLAFRDTSYLSDALEGMTIDPAVVDAVSEESAKGPIFPIIVEENGNLNAATREWSYANGATGDIGIELPYDFELVAVGFDADVAGTEVVIQIEQNFSSVIDLTFLGADGEASVNELTSPILFPKGVRLSFRTLSLIGTWTDCRIAAWFREV